jgi:3',5'-nucleoside bisphosphate phosphatase
VIELTKVDLHTHSLFSDGALAPAQLVARAAAAGVQMLSLTDHDTIAGIAEARAAAGEYAMQIIAGVELSASWCGQSVHVLGYDFDALNAGLNRALATQAEHRVHRLDRICERLGELGLPAAEIRAAVLANLGLPSRSHIAKALVAMGHASSVQDAFRRYLRRGRAAAIASVWPALADVIRWVREAGGAAVLAHPSRYALSASGRRRLVADFASAGGVALEIVSGGNAAQHLDMCAQLAASHGLAGTVGSDFHDPNLAWNPLGRSLKLPDYIPALWHRFRR